MALRFLTPFAFLALLPLGVWLGGAWTFLAAGATPLCLAGLDAALGVDPRTPDETVVPRWVPRLYLSLQLAMNVLAAAWVSKSSTNLVEWIGCLASCGVTTGVFGFIAAHEMIHSPDRRERALGLTFLASVLYMHFRISHVYGHHRRAGTFDDAASARLGEGLYAFLARTVAGQFDEAWRFEAKRLRRIGKRVIGPGNRMVFYLAIEAAFLLALLVISGRALFFVIMVAVIAVFLLEAFNYIAHYGLTRTNGPDGRAEKLAPHHSWNSRRRMNNAALLNMGRHSDHHRLMTRSYADLEEIPGGSQLPSGYAAALLTALIPQLWHKTMAPRAQAVMARHAPR
ncbi:MAG TPA: alkane 1-monooxygenase [Sphingomicrobium sp.]|nr:alkane 1-monooxygenase [Sphingomicrobium sp.]